MQLCGRYGSDKDRLSAHLRFRSEIRRRIERGLSSSDPHSPVSECIMLTVKKWRFINATIMIIFIDLLFLRFVCISCLGLLCFSLHAEESNVDTNLNNTLILWLNNHSSQSPKEVTVTNNVKAIIIGEDQGEVGSIIVSAGTAVKVTQFAVDILHIKMGSLCLKIPTMSTDFISTVNTIYLASKTDSPQKVDQNPQDPIEKETLPGGIKGWLGLYLGTVTEQYAVRINLPTTQESGYGARIIDVAVNSPASRHLLQPGDVITEYNNIRISTPDDLKHLINSSKVGSLAQLKVWVPDSKIGWKNFSMSVEEGTSVVNSYRNDKYVNTLNSETVVDEQVKSTSKIENQPLSKANFSTPELISSAFAKNPSASAAYLTTREITVSGRVMKFAIQDPDKFVIGLIMTSELRPTVIFTDDIKKLFGLISKDVIENNNIPEHINNTWLISGSELVLHSEWNVTSPDWQRNPYLYQNYPHGYVPKIIKQQNKPVIGIGEERTLSVRFIKANPNTVYFEIVK